MKVLLSIKPEFADKIFSGEKRFEYRRSLFRRAGVTTVVVYATQPTGMIVGEFDISAVLEGDPAGIWERTKQYSGISSDFFFQYFSGKKHGYAIKIGKVRKYQESINPYSTEESFVAPQSFKYLDETVKTKGPSFNHWLALA